MRYKERGTGLFKKWCYVTTSLGTKKRHVKRSERAEAYRLRSKHRDIMEMSSPPYQPPAPSEYILKEQPKGKDKTLVLDFSNSEDSVKTLW